jgi:hypothetical protein
MPQPNAAASPPRTGSRAKRGIASNPETLPTQTRTAEGEKGSSSKGFDHIAGVGKMVRKSD